jgi:hypothetical protein
VSTNFTIEASLPALRSGSAIVKQKSETAPATLLTGLIEGLEAQARSVNDYTKVSWSR